MLLKNLINNKYISNIRKLLAHDYNNNNFIEKLLIDTNN